MYLSLLPVSDMFRQWLAALRAARRSFVELTAANVGLLLLVFGFEIFTRLAAKDAGVTLALGAILSVPYTLATIVLNLATLETTHAALAGTALPLRDSLVNGLHKLLSAIGISILQFLITIATMVPFGIFVWMVSYLTKNALSTQAARMGIFLFALVSMVAVVTMIVVTVLVNMKVRFATNSLVADHTRSIDSIKASWLLTTGRLWQVVWRSVVMGLAPRFPLPSSPSPYSGSAASTRWRATPPSTTSPSRRACGPRLSAASA
jgi:hypothetical protein